MTRDAEIRALIEAHQSRLYQLEIRQARMGANTPPEILIEINDINTTLKKLRADLATLTNSHLTHFSPDFRDNPTLPDPPDAPFIAGPPISHPRAFFGRTRIINRLFHLWRRPPLQNAAIIGPRRSGKTSLLHYLKHITRLPADQRRSDQRADWLDQPKQVRWIFVDFQDPRLGSQAGLLHYLLHSLDLTPPTPCRLEDFMEVVSQQLTQPTIILMDEMGVALERYPDLNDTFWDGLRALATNQVGGRLAFVLAAHAHPTDLAGQSQLGSPFFNIFGYTTRLGPLAEAEARQLIAASPRPFTEADITWLLTHSQGWPYLLQILCRERLAALEAGETDAAWQQDGLTQIEPLRRRLAD